MNVHFAGPYRIAELHWTEGGEQRREARGPGADVSDLPSGIQSAITAEWTPEVIAAYGAATAPVVSAPTAADVDVERDRRIASGFSFGEVRYQTRPEDRENIAGAATAALAAIVAGAGPGDLRWHGGDSDFVWIAEDNSLVSMAAPTVLAFGQAAMAHKQSMIFAARAIKDMDPIPADYADDGYWP